MLCKNCKNEISYSRNVCKTKRVNDKIYNLSICEECLISKHSDYLLKNKLRIFNTCNAISAYAFQIPDTEIKKKNLKDFPSLENFIVKYGKEFGTQKWEEYRKKLSRKNTLEFHVEKWGVELGHEKYKKYNKDKSATKENFIRRHSDGEERWKRYVERQSFTESLEYCLEKWGEEGRLIYAERQKRKIVNLETLQKKWGAEEGLIRYEKMMNKRFEAISKSPGFSRKAQLFFEKVIEKLPNDLASEVSYSGNKEKFFLVQGYFFSVDFYIPSLSLIVEFYGDYWHCNPKIYKADDMIFGGKTARDIWDYDKKRIEKLKDAANHIIIVWELDMIESITLVTNKIIEIWNMNMQKMK